VRVPASLPQNERLAALSRVLREELPARPEANSKAAEGKKRSRTAKQGNICVSTTQPKAFLDARS
jgi:hypothetical protein